MIHVRKCSNCSKYLKGDHSDETHNILYKAAAQHDYDNILICFNCTSNENKDQCSRCVTKCTNDKIDVDKVTHLYFNKYDIQILL